MSEVGPDNEHIMTDVDYIIMGVNPNLAKTYEQAESPSIHRRTEVNGAEMDTNTTQPDTTLARHPLFDVSVHIVE